MLFTLLYKKFLNPVNKHSERVSLKDKEFVKKLEDELEYNFDNVKIKDLTQIENVYVYTYDATASRKSASHIIIL